MDAAKQLSHAKRSKLLLIIKEIQGDDSHPINYKSKISLKFEPEPDPTYLNIEVPKPEISVTPFVPKLSFEEIFQMACNQTFNLDKRLDAFDVLEHRLKTDERVK
jgi:hypothetical protein